LLWHGSHWFGRGGSRWRRRDILVALQGLKLHTHDLGLDDDVVRTADHQEMFDIVPPHDDKLALSVKRKGVDQTQPRLARLAPARKAQPMAEKSAISDNQGDNRNERYSREYGDLQDGFVAKRKIS
jgi:hypothetical protein